MKSERSGEPIEEQGEQLREELELARKRAGGVRQWRCSGELRERIVRYAISCSAEGEAHRRIALRLGLDQATLSRWIREAPGNGSAFRQVAIVPAGHDEHGPLAFGVRLVTPHGFIVEGLELEHLAALLRVLG
jgi:hypothetical protein